MAATWRKQYDRVVRWHARLGEQVADVDEARRVDDFYAFFVFCYHLKDWIKNDATVARSVRDGVESFVKNSPSVALSGDITNGVKHLTRDRPARIDPSARASAIPSAFQAGAFQRSAFQIGGIVVLGDQPSRDAKQLADDCLADWKSFLRRNGLL